MTPRITVHRIPIYCARCGAEASASVIHVDHEEPERYRNTYIKPPPGWSYKINGAMRLEHLHLRCPGCWLP
jgi:hypothetical protein